MLEVLQVYFQIIENAFTLQKDTACFFIDFLLLRAFEAFFFGQMLKYIATCKVSPASVPDGQFIGFFHHLEFLLATAAFPWQTPLSFICLDSGLRGRLSRGV
jgi:hypothetical protein